MIRAIFKRTSRWIHQDGWRGSYRKIKYALRYWHFRLWVFRLRKSRPQSPFSPTGFESSKPLFSILLPAYRTHPAWLRKAVHSIRSQGFGNWELCIGLCEIHPKVHNELRVLSQSDPRIRIFDLDANHGISGNSNLIAKEAKGEFLGLLDHDDYLEPHALQEFALRLSSGEVDLIYSDEDVVSPHLKIPSPPNLKPQWAPESFGSCNYICHFSCFRRSLFEQVGGFRSEYDGAQDYDLFLRLTEKTSRIVHVPKVLYHWRRHGFSTAAGQDVGAKSSAWEAGRLAMKSHLERVGEKAEAEFGKAFGTLRVRYVRETDPLVDVIIPSTNQDGTLVRCLDSILNQTRYSNYRITVMLNGPGDFDALRAAYENQRNIRMRYYSGPFNFSRINNVAAAESEGEVLLFLNDDIEVAQSDWIEGLLEHAMRSQVGASGPMLLYPDGTIQHAGIAVDPDYIGWDMHRHLPQNSGGYQMRAQMIQNVSAVTGACLCTRKDLFLEVGGFDEQFPLAYNDIDYCLKLLQKKRRIVYTPYVRLTHHESLTRGIDFHGEKWDRLQLEMRRMLGKWGPLGFQDRFFDAKIFNPASDLEFLAADYLTTTEIQN